ncbi:unnamed protein product [Linum trigynum]|uniref:Uncharacterized protein n=1 Tax=Linum trigynum TaxID=586398 RepID=A0AAV2FDI9_9ROSI
MERRGSETYRRSTSTEVVVARRSLEVSSARRLSLVRGEMMALEGRCTGDGGDRLRSADCSRTNGDRREMTAPSFASSSPDVCLVVAAEG